MRLIQYVINNYSTSHVLLMFLICFGAISLFCSWILKNYFPRAIINDAEGNQAAGILFAMFTGFYALLLAFIIVMLWGGISENQQLIFEESGELAILTRLGAAVEQQQPANQLKPAIKQYIHDVDGIEWQNFRKGVSGAATEKALNDLYTAVLGLSPKGFQDRVAYTEMIQVVGKLVVTHRNRELVQRAKLSRVLSYIPYSLVVLLFQSL